MSTPRAMPAFAEVIFLPVPGGCVAVMDAKRWSHPRDLRTRDVFRATSRERLVQALDRALRNGGIGTQSFTLMQALGMGPLSARAMRDEILRRFDARMVSAVWIPELGGDSGKDLLPGYQRGARSTVPPPQPRRGLAVGAMTLEDRCREVLVRTYHQLDDSLKDEFLALIQTETLVVGLASSLAAAIIGAYFGITQILAILMLVVGGFFMGVAVFHAATDLVRAFALLMGARDDADLDEAAKLLAGVIAVVTVEVFVAIVAKGVKRARARNAAARAAQAEAEATDEYAKRGFSGRRGDGRPGADGPDRGLELRNNPPSVTRNSPATINGRPYSGHAIDQMQNRGIPPSVVDNTIRNGTPFSTRPGSGTTGYYDAVNGVRVIVNSRTGNVVTVIPGKP